MKGGLTVKSKLGEIMREERERRGMSQRELASMTCVDRANISRYETGVKDIPHDMICRAVRALGSHKLRAQACFECQINLLTMPYLDLVDMHPMTVITVLVEELQEASEAFLALRLANKRSADELTAQDRQAMAHAGEQVIDLLAGINTLLEMAGDVSMNDVIKLTLTWLSSRASLVKEPQTSIKKLLWKVGKGSMLS